jgi:hypothetical protein
VKPRILTFIILALLAGAAGCTRSDYLTGSWQCDTAEVLFLPGSASKVYTLDFASGQTGRAQCVDGSAVEFKWEITRQGNLVLTPLKQHAGELYFIFKELDTEHCKLEQKDGSGAQVPPLHLHRRS